MIFDYLGVVVTAVALLTVEFELGLGHNLFSLTTHAVPEDDTTLHRSPAVFVL